MEYEICIPTSTCYLMLATAYGDLACSLHVMPLQLLLVGANSQCLHVWIELLAADG